MIITCKECSTSFNLDDSLVKESGSKCQCSVCKYIFTIYPPPLEDDQMLEEPLDLSFESDSSGFEIEEDNLALEEDTDLAIEPSNLEMNDNDFSLEEDIDLEIESSDLELEDNELELDDDDLELEDNDLEVDETKLEIEDDFSLDESELKLDEDSVSQEESEKESLDFDDDDLDFEIIDDDDSDGLEFEVSEEDQSDSIKEDDELGLEIDEDDNDFELEFDVEDDDAVNTEKTDKVSPLDMGTDQDDITSQLNSTKEIEEEDPLVITPEDDFSEYDAVLEQEAEPDDDLLEEEQESNEADNGLKDEETDQDDSNYDEYEKPILVPSSDALGKKRRKAKIGTPVLLLMLLCLIVIGAYIASLMTGYKIPYISNIQIPFIEQYLKKQNQKVPAAKPVPNQKSVNGRFVTNSTAGTLFVITGRVENPSRIAYSHIQVNGSLITQKEKNAKSKSVYCGNIITEEMLKSGNITDINKILANKTGNNNLNANVKPKASIPFMIVLSELPDKLQNFTVTVTGFEKVKNK